MTIKKNLNTDGEQIFQRIAVKGLTYFAKTEGKVSENPKFAKFGPSPISFPLYMDDNKESVDVLCDAVEKYCRYLHDSTLRKINNSSDVDDGDKAVYLHAKTIADALSSHTCESFDDFISLISTLKDGNGRTIQNTAVVSGDVTFDGIPDDKKEGKEFIKGKFGVCGTSASYYKGVKNFLSIIQPNAKGTAFEDANITDEKKIMFDKEVECIMKPNLYEYYSKEDKCEYVRLSFKLIVGSKADPVDIILSKRVSAMNTTQAPRYTIIEAVNSEESPENEDDIPF